MRFRVTRALRWLGLGLAAFALACSQEPPQLLTLRDLDVAANETVSFDVAATDPDTAQLTFGLKPALKGAQLVQIEGKLAKFTWTPNPAQAGVNTLTFTASDGTSTDTETINIRVSSDDAPELLTPDRYVFDPATTTEVKFSIEWKDAESTSLDFTFDPDPTGWGALLEVEAKKIGFSWSPSEQQKRTTQHLFVVTATDGDGHGTTKPITIVFRAAQAQCDPTLDLPEVVSDPVPDQAGDQPYPLGATATDADSAIRKVVAFWTDVASPTENDWQTAELTSEGSGDRWTGTIPNLNLAAGTSKRVTYQVCALDDDDPEGDACDGWGCALQASFNASAPKVGGACDPCDTSPCSGGFTCRTIRRVTKVTTKQCVPTTCSASSNDPACTCGELVINEVLADAPLACPAGMATCTSSEKLTVDVNGDGARKVAEADEEFVEIVNVSATKSLQMQGVTLFVDLQSKFTFPSMLLAPGAAVVIFGGGDAASFPVRANTTFFSAVQSGGRALALVNGHGAVAIGTSVRKIDSVEWATATQDQSIVREREGQADARMIPHKNALASQGPFSPGAHADGTPFSPP